MITWQARLGMGKLELQGGPGERLGSPPPPFLGNLSRQALKLRQEAGSGYQEWGVGGEYPGLWVKGAGCGGGRGWGERDKKKS